MDPYEPMLMSHTPATQPMRHYRPTTSHQLAVDVLLRIASDANTPANERISACVAVLQRDAFDASCLPSMQNVALTIAKEVA